MKPLLSVENFSLFSDKKALLLDCLNFQVQPHSITCIVGESGSGKSLTALSLCNLQPSSFSTSGRITFLDKAPSQKLLGHEIAYIFQNPSQSLSPLHKVGTQIRQVLRLVKKEGSIKAITELLSQVHLPSRVQDAYPFELSGGMQQRVNIALALACDPKLIIADEPTSSLDPTVAQSLTSLFRELAQTKTLLIITHDLGLVKHCANQVLVFYSGQIVEVAPPDLFFTSPKMPYSQALLQASQFDKESIAAFDKADEAPAAIGALANKLDAQPIACGVPTSGCRFANRCVLQIQECLTQPIVLKGTLKSTMQNLEKDAEKETVKDTTQHHYRCIL